MTVSMQIPIAFLTLSLGLFGCGRPDQSEQKTPPLDPPDRNEKAVRPHELDADCRPSPEVFSKDPAKLEVDVREGILHVSKCRIIPGTSNQSDVEKILGPHDAKEVGGSSAVHYYKKLGILYGTYYKDGVHKPELAGIVQYVDIYLSDPEVASLENTFPGKLRFNGRPVHANTTRASFITFGAKVSEDFRPGYRLEFRKSKVAVELVMGSQRISSFRFSEP